MKSDERARPRAPGHEPTDEEFDVAATRRLTLPRSFQALATRATWLEDVAVVIAAFLATLHAEWRMIVDPLVLQTDAQIHEFWMRRFQDSSLFHDPLTDALLSSGYSPLGYRLLYWLGSHVIDPVDFGELLPLALQPVCVWLVFRIVRAHAAWRPAAWIAGALFLVPWDIHRFSGGHPRAFAQPVVLLTVYLLLSRRNLLAALVPSVGLLFYPPAGLLALVIVLLASLERRRPPFLDARRAVWAGVSALGAAATVLVPRLFGVPSGELITEAQAREYPEFGPGGQMHFFASSTLEFLKQNYSGFALGDSGSILAVAALVLLAVRFRNVMLLRWEVLCMPVASLGLFAAAHALLFHLYLPHRYTYPLIPFFCIAIALSVRPTLDALTGRRRLALLLAPVLPLALGLLALTVFPLGPQLSLSRAGAWLADATPYLAVGLALGLAAAATVRLRRIGDDDMRTGSAAAIVGAAILVAGVAFAGGGESPGVTRCRDTSLYDYLRTLPEDSIIAGDPLYVDCVPIAARRPVVISRKLYQPWERDYFAMIRDRMFRTMRAYYGSSVPALAELRTRYGADYIVVRTRVRERPWRRMAPFTQELRRLLRSVDVPAALRLPEQCRTWRSPKFEVYDLACNASARSQ